MASVFLGQSGNYEWYLDYTYTQSTANNQTTFSPTLRIKRLVSAANGAFSLSGNKTFYGGIGGTEKTVTITSFDFRNSETLSWALPSIVKTHNADGTLPAQATLGRYRGPAVSNGFDGNDGVIDVVGGSITVPTIPRATTPALSDSTPDTAQAVTITLTPASAGFTHRLHWAFQAGTGGVAVDNKIFGLAGGGGAASGTVEGSSADGTAGNYWGTAAGTQSPTLTIPHDIFLQAKSEVTRTVTLTVITYSGTTLVGTKTITMQVTLAATQKPTLTGVTDSEATTTPAVATLVGAYVQSVTKLNLAVTGAAGIHGSTIASREIKVAGQTLTADGVTPNPIATSGTVAITATVTDSRGRVSTVFSKNVTVLAWTPPQFAQAVSVKRALSSGVTDEDDGTYIKVDPADFSASSLVVASVQKNKIEYRLSYRLVGAATWTVDGAGWIDLPDTPSVIRFTGTRLSTFGSAALGSAYEVLIEIRDVLATSSVTRIIPKAQVLFMLKGSLGVSFGARHSGAANPLEIWGRGKQASGGTTLQNILDVGDLATTSEVLAGTSAVKAVTPASLSGSGTYRYVQTVKFEASGTFTKASYPWLKAVRVRVQAAGGASGGAPSNPANQHSSGGGGGGGGYAEKFVLASNLAASETVTIGAAGAPGAAGAGGGNAANSSFGTHAVATGGLGGGIAASSGLMIGALGGAGGAGTTGDLLVDGQSGGMGSGYATLGHGGLGGSAVLGGGGRGAYTGAGSGTAQGAPGGQYGGGGGGSTSNSGGAAIAGAAGAPGIIILDLYA